MADIALYHPWIDPTNGTTLRTAMLYFDHMETIVPESVEQPFVNRHSAVAAALGFLRPRVIHSNDPSVLTTSIEFSGDYTRPVIQESMRHARDKAGLKDGSPAWLSGEKISMEFRHTVLDGQTPDHDGFYRVSEGFGLAYMSRLAANIATEEDKIAYTDQPLSHEVVFDGLDRRDDEHPVDRTEAILARLSIEALSIPSRVPMHRLWSFRAEQYDLLLNYRKAIRNLSRSLSGIQRLDHLYEEANRLVKEEIKPHIDEIRGKLHDQRIDYGTHVLEGVCTGVAAFITKGLSAALTAAGIKIGFSSLRAKLNANKIGRDPYAYLFRARSAFPPEG